MTEFVMMMGLPGSGKSTYATEHFHSPDYEILSSDLIRNELELGHSKKDNAEVFKIMNNRAIDELRNGHNVVYDATNLQRKYRVQMLRNIMILVRGFVHTRLILMLKDFDDCRAYNNLRSGWARVPDDVMEHMYMSFESPAYYEGWDQIDIDFDSGDSTVKDFYIAADLEHFDQQNPHHKFTLGKHLAATANYLMQKDITDFGLVTAGLYHDYGKVKTQSFINKKGETTDEAHYYNHHNVGAYDVMQILLHDKIKLRDVIDICDLICLHMDPIIVWPGSQRRFDEYMKLAGRKQTARVLLLSEADRASHGTISDDRKFILETAEEGVS